MYLCYAQHSTQRCKTFIIASPVLFSYNPHLIGTGEFLSVSLARKYETVQKLCVIKDCVGKVWIRFFLSSFDIVSSTHYL